jgi:hypothetical protein
MRKLVTLVATAAVVGGLVAYAVTSTRPTKAAPAVSAASNCQINMRIRDMSQVGQPLVVVDPADNDQLVDATSAGQFAAYPTNYIYELCYEGEGNYALENQIPGSAVEHLWIGANINDNGAIQSAADGPGAHELFRYICRGINEAFIQWQYDETDGMTSVGGAPGANPPQLWSNGPTQSLYQLGGVCSTPAAVAAHSSFVAAPAAR